MHSDLTSGLRLPPYTALLVVVGTIDDPEEIIYFYKDNDQVDAITPISYATEADFINDGYYIIGRLYVDKVNNSSYIIYNNPNKDTSRLNFYNF